MCSGLGLGHALRGNTPKYTHKWTKHTHKHTMHPIAKHDKMVKNMTCVGTWVGDVVTRMWGVFMGSDVYSGTCILGELGVGKR